MALQSVKNLPLTIVRTYQNASVHADTITEVWNGVEDSGNEAYEVTFDDGTYDVWEWMADPAKQGMVQDHSWLLTTKREPVDDEDEEIALHERDEERDEVRTVLEDRNHNDLVTDDLVGRADFALTA